MQVGRLNLYISSGVMTCCDKRLMASGAQRLQLQLILGVSLVQEVLLNFMKAFQIQCLFLSSSAIKSILKSRLIVLELVLLLLCVESRSYLILGQDFWVLQISNFLSRWCLVTI